MVSYTQSTRAQMRRELALLLEQHAADASQDSALQPLHCTIRRQLEFVDEKQGVRLATSLGLLIAHDNGLFAICDDNREVLLARCRDLAGDWPVVPQRQESDAEQSEWSNVTSDSSFSVVESHPDWIDFLSDESAERQDAE